MNLARGGMGATPVFFVTQQQAGPPGKRQLLVRYVEAEVIEVEDVKAARVSGRIHGCATDGPANVANRMILSGP